MKRWVGVLFLLTMVSISGSSFAAGQDDLVTTGKALYVKNCARCHGLGGVGTDKGPPFLNKIYRPSHHSDMSFLMAALNGVRAHHWSFGNMPPVEGVGMAEVGMITQYIRSIQREAGIY